MLDSDQEPSYNLSKNFLFLPRILKLIEDMVDDSTPLIMTPLQKNSIYLDDCFFALIMEFSHFKQKSLHSLKNYYSFFFLSLGPHVHRDWVWSGTAQRLWLLCQSQVVRGKFREGNQEGKMQKCKHLKILE